MLQLQAWPLRRSCGGGTRGTRAIYLAAQREIRLKLTNGGNGPVLVQPWANDGDPHVMLGEIQALFTLIFVSLS